MICGFGSFDPSQNSSSPDLVPLVLLLQCSWVQLLRLPILFGMSNYLLVKMSYATIKSGDNFCGCILSRIKSAKMMHTSGLTFIN